MSTVRRHRSPTIQLELPLSSSPSEATKRLQADWHLDERTRRIGRRGVAAARALLEDRTPALEDTADRGPAVGTVRGTGQGKAGRAA